MLFLLLCLLTQERGGIMSLTEVYCLVNRARGLEVRHCFGSLCYNRTSVTRKFKRVEMFPTSCSFYLSTTRCDQLFVKNGGVLPFSFLIVPYNTYISFISCSNFPLPCKRENPYLSGKKTYRSETTKEWWMYWEFF